MNPTTILEASNHMRDGRLTSVELVERCLAAIEQFDQEIKAWVVVDADGARETAAARDRERTSGQLRGPLHGIPLAIKDIVDVAGFPTLAGSPLREGHCAQHDATVVQRLREAGAVILGKTVTTEWASFDPPPTCNPWNTERTPGGSSSGSAAAVALGMCLAAIGSQTGGSISRPAAYCGVAGCKPTHGRVSTTGVVPVSYHLDHVGPIARCAGDLAIMLQAIAGPDPLDPWTAQHAVSDFTAQVNPAQPPRLGILGEFFHEHADDEARRVTEHTIKKLQAAGATAEEVRLPNSFDRVPANHRMVMAVEAAEYHRDRFPAEREQFGTEIGRLLADGCETDVRDYAAALAHRRLFQHELRAPLDQFDALICPATTSPAPTVDTTGDPRFNSPWSYAGVPTVSLTCDLASDGLPLGIQLVGAPWQEARLLSVAAWCEARIDFDRIPPMLAIS